MNKIASSIVRYAFVEDLWIISCIYNSGSYQSKNTNFDRFIKPIEAAGLNYLIVDCAFGTQPFNLKKHDRIIRIRAPHVLWQKERLLNIAIERLPTACKKVAWVDCDVLFKNPDWALETSEKLDYFKAVQPFKEAVRLPKQDGPFSEEDPGDLCFAYKLVTEPRMVAEGRFPKHGHTGYAWAMQVDLLKTYGLYDACIAGSGDHVMAHAFAGGWETACVKKVFGNNTNHYEHYVNWAKKIHPHINSDMTYVDGALLHLWHGDLVDRKYTDREKILQQFQFDPERDIELNTDRCWVWKGGNPELQAWIEDYFVSRKED